MLARPQRGIAHDLWPNEAAARSENKIGKLPIRALHTMAILRNLITLQMVHMVNDFKFCAGTVNRQLE